MQKRKSNYNSTGPNGAIMIYRNPYYINKDPLKTILLDGDNGSIPKK